MKAIAYIVFLSVLTTCFGCVSATVSEPSLCDTQTVSFGSIPPEVSQAIQAAQSSGVSIAPQQVNLPPQDVSYDFSSTLKKVSDIANDLQVDITQLVITNTGDLNWVRSVSVQITGSAEDGSTQPAPLATYSTTGQPGSELSVNVQMSGAELLHYLESGTITLDFSLSGEVSESNLPSGSLSNTVNLCVSASGKFSKSL
jgi:hypothetical protein